MAKREDGAGTWTEHRSRNMWEYRLSFGYHANGERHRKSFYGKTKTICRQKAKEYKDSLDNQVFIFKEVRLGAWLGAWLDEWLETYKKNTVNGGTFTNYQYCAKIIKTHKIATLKLNEIKPLHIQGFINDNESYSLTVLKKLRILLNGAFETALDNELCLKNPTKKVKLPKKPTVSRDAFTDAEIQIIHDHATTDKEGYLIELLLQTGMRSGEARALEWSHIDFEKDIIHIRHAVKSDKEIGLPKNGKPRDIPLMESLKNILLSLSQDSKYVIHDTKGNFCSKDGFRHMYEGFFKRMNNPEVRMLSAHCFRHTYGSQLLKKNLSLKHVQELMGHSDIQTTANIYTHLTTNDLVQAVKQIVI